MESLGIVLARDSHEANFRIFEPEYILISGNKIDFAAANAVLLIEHVSSRYLTKLTEFLPR